MDSQEEKKPQTPDGHTRNVPTISTHTDADPSHEPSQQTGGQNSPQGQGNGGVEVEGVLGWLGWLGKAVNWFYLTGIGAGVFAFRFYREWLKDRPHLAAHWDIKVREDKGTEGTVTIENVGKTPAKLRVHALTCELLPSVPERFDYARLLSEELKGTELIQGGKFTLPLPSHHIGTVEMSRMQGRRGGPLVLYAALRVEIKFLPLRNRSFTFEAVYDIGRRNLRPVYQADRRHNKHKK